MIPGPYSGLIGLIIAVPAVAVGLLEYAASFRQNGTAVWRLQRLHGVGFALCVIASGIIEFHNFTGGKRLPYFGWYMLVLLALALLALMSGWAHRRWFVKLDAWETRHPEAAAARQQRPFQITILEMLLAMTVVALVIGLASWIAF